MDKENLDRPTGPPGPDLKPTIHQVIGQRKLPDLKPNPRIPKVVKPKEVHATGPPMTYSEITRSGLQARHSPTDILEFEAIWLKARRPSSPNGDFPHRIEGLAPSIWHSMYINESKNYHKTSVSCLLCSKIDKIMKELFKCHKSALSPECSNCLTKGKNAPYLDRAMLADMHSKNLDLLLNGRVGGEVKTLRAKAWTSDKNYNKRNEPLLKQMERELSRFSRSQRTTTIQSWLPDRKKFMENKNPTMTTQNKQDQPDEEIRKESKRATVTKKEDTSRDNHLHKEKEPCSRDKINAKANLEPTEKDSQPSQNSETIAAIKEKSKETHLLTDFKPDPPVSSGEDLEHDIPWTKEIDDEPWEHAFYVGGSYPE